MFKKEFFEKAANVLRIPEDKQEEFINIAISEDKDQDWDSVPEKLHTPDELTQFGQNRFSEGKTAMSEITVKDLRKQFPDVTYQGKSLPEFMDRYAEWKIKEAQLPVEEQVTTLKTEKEALQNELKAQSEKFGSEVGNLNQQLFSKDMNYKVLSMLPSKDTVIDKSDILTVFNNEHSFNKDDDGNLTIMKDGKPLKDELQNNIPLDKYLPGWIDQKKFIKRNGMGGGDGSGSFSGKFINMKEFTEYCEQNNLSPMSDEAQKLLHEKKADTFDYDH